MTFKASLKRLNKMLEIAPRRNREQLKKLSNFMRTGRSLTLKPLLMLFRNWLIHQYSKRRIKHTKISKNKYSEATPITGIIQRTNQKLAEKKTMP